MEKVVASLLLVTMLSLQARLLVAELSTAADAPGYDMGSLIRLPSDAADAPGGPFPDMGSHMRLPRDDDTAALGKRPWKCCDLQPCTRSIPAICMCRDLLEQCSASCKECGKVAGSNPPRYICKDVYRGWPAPRCHEDQAGKNQQVAGAEEMVAAVVRGSSSKEAGGRPWKCCNKAVMGPTTEGKVVWYCMDAVNKCTCDHCYELSGKRYYCLDGYQGADPGPSCATHA